MKRHYAYRLGLYARVLLWSKGELKLDHQQVRQALALLQASLKSIEAQLAVAEHLLSRRSESPAPNAERREADGDAPTQPDLPFEDPPF